MSSYSLLSLSSGIPMDVVRSLGPTNMPSMFSTELIIFSRFSTAGTLSTPKINNLDLLFSLKFRKAISTLTNSGYTAYQISSWRPKTHVLVFTSNMRILTQLNLLWGVKAFYYDGTESTDRTIEEINKIAVENNLLQKDDKVINLTSMPIEKKGMVNTVRVSKI